jgi:hypothetical protein
MAARLFRMVCLTVLVGHVVLAILSRWMQPGEAPLGQPRSWSNRAAPFVVQMFAIGTLRAIHRDCTDLLHSVAGFTLGS